MRQVGVGWRETPGRPDRPEPRTLTRTRSELSPAGRSAGGGAGRQLVHVVGSGGWVCVSSVSGGGGGGGGSTRTGSSLACVWRDAAAACRCGALHVSRLGSLPGRLAWPACIAALSPSLTRPFFTHSLSVSLCPHCLASRYGQGEHRTRLTSEGPVLRWRGSRAQSAERATHTERWLHLPCPVFFPCHTHFCAALHVLPT